MAMADAAFREGLHQSALKFLGELYTADSAYKEAQVLQHFMLELKYNKSNVRSNQIKSNHIESRSQSKPNTNSNQYEPSQITLNQVRLILIK